MPNAKSHTHWCGFVLVGQGDDAEHKRQKGGACRAKNDAMTFLLHCLQYQLKTIMIMIKMMGIPGTPTPVFYSTVVLGL